MARFSSIGSTLATISLISFIIFFHELGHFTACKLFNVPTPIFSIGFGPALIQKKIGTTTFQLALIPLGGFVSIDAAVLAQKAYWQKMIIILAGVFNNILLCFLIIFLLSIAHRRKYSAIIKSIKSESPAEAAGLKEGDHITAFNGIAIADSMTPFLRYLHSYPGQEIVLSIYRNGEQQEIHCALTAHSTSACSIEKLGISLKQHNQTTSFTRSFMQSLHLMKNIVRQGGGLASTHETQKSAGIVGPIGILSLGSQALRVGPSIFFFWVALISAQIGFFNLLPLPFLDGGQAVQFTAQSLVGRQLTTREASLVNYLMMMVLISLLFWASSRRIKKGPDDRTTAP